MTITWRENDEMKNSDHKNVQRSNHPYVLLIYSLVVGVANCIDSRFDRSQSKANSTAWDVSFSGEAMNWMRILFDVHNPYL